MPNLMSPLQFVQNHLRESAATKQRLASSGVLSLIVHASERLAGCVTGGGKIMLCGNGGSAADSQHLAAEFTNRLRPGMQRPGIPAIALTTDSSYLTARANDYGFDDVFERLVSCLGQQSDALIGISTSGNSLNVIRAVSCAKEKGILTVGLLGGAGGKLAGLVDIPIVVPSDSTQHIQETHVVLGHILCELVEELLFGDLHSMKNPRAAQAQSNITGERGP